MDTRGKSNAEFRIEFNEILTQHEPNFDHLNNNLNQFNATLQIVLTKLQALHVNHHGHTTETKINPFGQGDISLSFPKFGGNDPIGWIYKAEQFSNFKKIAPYQKVQLASFHLEGITLQPSTWDGFTTAVLYRFGPPYYDNPSEALTRLKQVSIVEVYWEAFEKLS
ncbi:hypothetical protein ACOSQ4_018765 [Xanthoceras sorbifolium]